MSTKTSTAALDTVRFVSLHPPRRVPRHPAGARERNGKRSIQRRTESSLPFQQATIKCQEEPMNATAKHPAGRDIRTIFPVILRITLSLILWTFGAASMNIPSMNALQ
jgi:hypothetical protein